jgi:epoxyqueuosine reductase
MQCLIKRIQAKLGWFEAGVFSDAVSILERAVAARGGLGFVGKNTLLIRPGQGSFFLLGEIVWELDICDQPETPAYAGCRSCTRCLNACPTNAFVDERVLDARKCIAYLSIEKRGMLSLWERRALGNWIFGCDVCQEVCPFNHAVQKEGREPDLVNLGALKGAGKILNLSAVLRIRTQEVWRTSFAHTALERARRAGLLRNAACVAVNTGAVALIPDLVNAFKEDSAPAVRATSFWALSEFYNLGALSHSAWCSIVQAAKSDVSSEVQKEYALLEAIS